MPHHRALLAARVTEPVMMMSACVRQGALTHAERETQSVVNVNVILRVTVTVDVKPRLEKGMHVHDRTAEARLGDIGRGEVVVPALSAKVCRIFS